MDYAYLFEVSLLQFQTLWKEASLLRSRTWTRCGIS